MAPLYPKWLGWRQCVYCKRHKHQRDRKEKVAWWTTLFDWQVQEDGEEDGRFLSSGATAYSYKSSLQWGSHGGISTIQTQSVADQLVWWSKDLIDHLENFKAHITLHGFSEEVACHAFPLVFTSVQRDSAGLVQESRSRIHWKFWEAGKAISCTVYDKQKAP